MIQILRENYQTYFDTALGRPERHVFRLAAFAALSLLFASFASNSTSDVYSMMATGITVLTGFSFTALFSDNALPSADLPKPTSENDRHDLVRLKKLAKNFRARSSYFITLSILEVVLLVAASFNFFTPIMIKLWLLKADWVQSITAQGLISNAQEVVSILSIIFALSIDFIYLECLYTFYRMAETILAILDTRRNYLNIDD